MWSWNNLFPNRLDSQLRSNCKGGGIFHKHTLYDTIHCQGLIVPEHKLVAGVQLKPLVGWLRTGKPLHGPCVNECGWQLVVIRLHCTTVVKCSTNPLSFPQPSSLRFFAAFQFMINAEDADRLCRKSIHENSLLYSLNWLTTNSTRHLTLFKHSCTSTTTNRMLTRHEAVLAPRCIQAHHTLLLCCWRQWQHG